MRIKRLKISYCIVCMNRLEHLKATLLKNIDDTRMDEDIEFVLLDYNSQDGMADWVEENLSRHIKSGRLIYFRTEEPKDFSHSHSKNMVFKLSTGDVLCSINADHFIGKGFSSFLREKFGKNKAVFISPQLPQNYKGSWRPPPDIFGKIALRSTDFHRTTGFDERFKGYGFEDIDFVNRLEMLSVKRVLLSKNEFCKFVSHDDRDRYKLKPATINKFYISYLAPEITKAIILYDDHFEECVFERQMFLEADKFTSAYTRKVTVAAFEIKDPKKKGRWSPLGNGKFSMVYDDGDIWICLEKGQNLTKKSSSKNEHLENYHKIDSVVIASKLEFNLALLNNWNLTKENIKNKQIRVNSKYGSGTIFKNFKRQPIYV